MAVKIPEFILAGMFVKGSLESRGGGFRFALKNSYAAATLWGLELEVDGSTIPPECLSLRLEGQSGAVPVTEIGEDRPLALPLNTELEVLVSEGSPEKAKLRIRVLTREVGPLAFSVRSAPDARRNDRWPGSPALSRIALPALRAAVAANAEDLIGTADPNLFGHFVEHLESCTYGGIWDDKGQALHEDVTGLIEQLAPPIIRYPGGNFASDYHWEDGIGPKDRRPARYNRAWHVEDPNTVGTDEFLGFCRRVGAQALLVVNDGSGSPEEAARWVAYCNEPAKGPVGRRRAANGHPEPWGVRWWGLGNEVWGDWQIGHTDAAGYVRRIRPFIQAMRRTDPGIRLVAVGLDHLENDPRGAAEWNRTVLEGIGPEIDCLSFHVYQPSEEGYLASYDQRALYRSLVAAPLSVEDAILRIAAQIEAVVPGRGVRVALDEWNVKLPPRPGAASMHEQEYTVRDALYVAGMLNAFQRCCRVMGMANLAMLVNVLGAIAKVTHDEPAQLTPVGLPFLLYRDMEPTVLRCRVSSPCFDAPALGLNISAKGEVPWLDASATRDEAGRRLVLALVNRHPERGMRVSLSLAGFEGHRPTRCRRLAGRGPLDRRVELTAPPLPAKRGARAEVRLPPASLTVIELESS
ncbi:MAG: hypothetical protein JW820_16945 [Spirochaetales bacterium]|nr:hypothetical protein [Spirochaetales bacterium]